MLRNALMAAMCGMATLQGCAPITVSATLFGENARLHERVVDEDRQGGSGKVVIIDVRGLIADRSPSPLLGSSANPVDELTARLRKAADDASVRAVILRINSPGGTVTASEMMYREIRRFGETTGKPVVASLGEVAASGGYYIALGADRIVAEPSTITASIGVIIPTLNVSEGLGKLGIRSRSIVSGGNKDIANPLEPSRAEHFALLQAIVDEFYAGFRDRVAERRSRERTTPGGGPDAPDARSVDPARLNQIADGRIMTGRRAVEEGLADQQGGVREAFETAKRLAGIPGARLVKYYREDADVPRTPYAPSAISGSQGGTELNLVQIRADSTGLWNGNETAGAYYLWLPPG